MMKSSLLSCIFLLFTVLSSYCIVIHVPSEYPTIQAGIYAADHGDTVLVADGIYSGEGNYNIYFGGRAIVLISENGPENCFIDALNIGRCFIFNGGETNQSVLSGFTLVNGLGDYFGGGIKIEASSSPTIENCIIRDCNAPG